MKIAVEGCAHGELDTIYGTLEYLAERHNTTIDLLLLCGDVQTIRDNGIDLPSLACPPKYRRLGDFADYASGLKRAPVLTIFIGGNHEASSHLWELYHGGWVAPNIYYLGAAGAVCVGDALRICGLSGIYNDRHYNAGYFERHPFHDEREQRSIYHVREYNVFRMQLFSELDRNTSENATRILLTHDWPRCATSHGDADALVRTKPFFAAEVRANALGSPASDAVLAALAPDYHFSAHLHVKFAAAIPRDGHESPTRFLALDKCLPGRDYLQVLTLPGAIGELSYDPAWLAVVRTAAPYWPAVSHPRAPPPRLAASAASLRPELERHLEWLRSLGRSFVVPPCNLGAAALEQTAAFCALLDIPDVISPSVGTSGANSPSLPQQNDEELALEL